MNFTTKKYSVLKKLYEHGIGKYLDLSIVDSEKRPSYPSSEMMEIANTLKEDGYVRLLKSKTSWSASITGKGVEHMESRLSESDQDSSDFTVDETNEMHQKLDEILQRLDKMDLGQQITYDDLLTEINELKELLSKLSKKNWREIFLGKMIDLGLGQLTEKGFELISAISESNNLT